MTDVWIGTADLPERVDRDRYFHELRYLEVSAYFGGPLKPATLKRWLDSTPKGALGLVAPWVLTHRKAPATSGWAHDATVGDFRDSTPGRTALSALHDAAVALEARCVVFRSPPAFAPSAANREQLKHFFGEVATADAVGATRVWVPDGLWEPQVAAKLATELEVTVAIDPLVREPGAPPEVYDELDVTSLYLRVEGLGRSGPIRPERMEDLAALLERYEDLPVTVAFASPNRWQDARNLRKLLES
jgi:uncharacterized protein YecE (DUF72 family)